MATNDVQDGNLQSPTPSEHPRPFFARSSTSNGQDDEEEKVEESKPAKWGMGILNDKLTNEVPGR
jgi:hypothetical protein